MGKRGIYIITANKHALLALLTQKMMKSASGRKREQTPLLSLHLVNKVCYIKSSLFSDHLPWVTQFITSSATISFCLNFKYYLARSCTWEGEIMSSMSQWTILMLNFTHFSNLTNILHHYHQALILINWDRLHESYVWMWSNQKQTYQLN